MNRSVISFITTWILEKLVMAEQKFYVVSTWVNIVKNFCFFIASASDWKLSANFFWALLLSHLKRKSNDKHQNIHILSLVFSPRLMQWRKTLFFWSCGFFFHILTQTSGQTCLWSLKLEKIAENITKLTLKDWLS